MKPAGATLFPRRSLRIDDPRAAGELTAIYVHAERVTEGIKVRVSVIYNDLSDHEWWKDKKEKVVGSYLIRERESVRPIELEQFGVEPLEMKAIDATPVVLKPGEGPRITNSAALEVAKLEKHIDGYRVWFKNRSSKGISAYTISTGSSSIDTSAGHGRTSIVLAPGETSPERYLYGPDVERDGLTVRVVVFEDGTFEGDAKLATKFLAESEGVHIQSPSVLRMIEQTLSVDDSDLRAAFDKLEADLWIIPEAMYKDPALQFLKSRFPDQDDKSISELYEVFKGGLYDARNIALAAIGDTRRNVVELEQRGQYATAVESIRRTLESVKGSLDKIVSAQR